MSRLHLTFECGSFPCAGTLDTAPSSTGLLIVSGGNEIRSGAFSGQSQLAERVAKAGFPVFRFDRRGVGDSDGENRGFRKSRSDIEAALAAFRAIAPQVERVVALGNCDAASALMLGEGCGCDALILSNPWTIDDDAPSAPPPEAVRERYKAKLKNPREWGRLLTGKVDLRRLAGGLKQASKPAEGPTKLADEMSEGLAQFMGPVRILLSGNDRTAQVFASNWDAGDTRMSRCDGASHAYVEPHAREWLFEQVIAALRA